MSASLQEKNGNDVHLVHDTDPEAGEVSISTVPEIEYVTGWRFVAVGIAIVMSMFLVRSRQLCRTSVMSKISNDEIT